MAHRAKKRPEAGREELDGVAAQALKLRKWFRDFVHKPAGRPLQSSALSELSTINRILARDNSYRQIEVGNVSKEDRTTKNHILQWMQIRRWRSLSPEALILPLAEAMGDLICHADFEQVKICEDPTCSLWFNDVSKNHTRRWCSMAVCGNRAKAAAHRAKNGTGSGLAMPHNSITVRLEFSIDKEKRDSKFFLSLKSRRDCKKFLIRACPSSEFFGTFWVGKKPIHHSYSARHVNPGVLSYLYKHS